MSVTLIRALHDEGSKASSWLPFGLLGRRGVLACVGIVAGAFAHTSAQDVKPAPTRSVWDGVYSEAQADRGKDQYLQSCGACHGKDLRGDSTAPSLVDESFAFQWDDTTVGELFTRIRTLMPSDRPNSLSPQRYRDVVAYILQVNKFPAGEKELDADALSGILISAKRPPAKRAP
jgi:quinoprotein glucose dehydrogenase